MKNILVTFWVESLKIRKSKMFWITILAFIFLPVMMGFLMWVSKNPDLARKLGILGVKARLFATTDWPAYFGMLNMVVAGLGLIAFGFVISWVFGREYSDRTVKDLLALPVSRSFIVLSKFIVVVIWCAILSVIFFIISLFIGRMIHISGWSGELVLHCAHTFSISALLTILLCTPVAFFASYGRGYLPPMGFVILTLALAQFSGVLGLSPYVPWAIPGVYSADSSQLNIVSYILLYFTSILGFFATFAWWRYADQT